MGATSQGSRDPPAASAASLRHPGAFGRVGKALQLGHAQGKQSLPEGPRGRGRSVVNSTLRGLSFHRQYTHLSSLFHVEGLSSSDEGGYPSPSSSGEEALRASGREGWHLSAHPYWCTSGTRRAHVHSSWRGDTASGGRPRRLGGRQPVLLLVVRCAPFGGEDLGSRSNGQDLRSVIAHTLGKRLLSEPCPLILVDLRHHAYSRMPALC